MVEKPDNDELGGKTKYDQQEEGVERSNSHGRENESTYGRFGK